jgi:serine/tyrosine/threonine adenylyltransferase
MDRVNPIYIPRNHKVEEALKAAFESDDFAPFETLLGVLQHPFTEKAEFAEFAEPAPESFGPYRTFCGT